MHADLVTIVPTSVTLEAITSTFLTDKGSKVTYAMRARLADGLGTGTRLVGLSRKFWSGGTKIQSPPRHEEIWSGLEYMVRSASFDFTVSSIHFSIIPVYQDGCSELGQTSCVSPASSWRVVLQAEQEGTGTITTVMSAFRSSLRLSSMNVQHWFPGPLLQGEVLP